MSQPVPQVALPPGLTLEYVNGQLALAGDERQYGKPLSVDFVSGKAAHRRQFGGGRGQLVAKACGLTKGITPSVVDATAGLGRDAFVLASLGAQVLMIERVEAIAALLQDGLERAASADETALIAGRMALRHATPRNSWQLSSLMLSLRLRSFIWTPCSPIAKNPR